MAVLEARNVGYYYYADKQILKKINMTFERGKFYAISGPSGCGKTTLLALLGGLDEPKSGQILFEGEDIKQKGLAWHRKHHVAFVFQNYNLIEYMTPKENVLLTAKENPEPILKSLGIGDEEMRRNVLKLSGGQQQRVAIARAIASQAQVILADEPTGNLDEDTAEEITRILKENAHKKNRCVIVVTHSEAIAKEADEVFRLSRGSIYQETKPYRFVGAAADKVKIYDEDIIYIDKPKGVKQVRYVTRGGEYQERGTIESVLETLPEGFVPAGRGCVVNIRYITRIHDTLLELDGQYEVEASRARVAGIKELLR